MLNLRTLVHQRRDEMANPIRIGVDFGGTKLEVIALAADGRELYRKAGVADADSAVIFFHGLGLSHWDIDGASPDWAFEAGMVVPLHMVYPGGETSRAWLEEVALITPQGGEPLFGWGYEPLLE